MKGKSVMLRNMTIVKIKDVLKRDLGLNQSEFIFVSECGVQFRESDICGIQTEMEFSIEKTDNYLN